MAAPKPAPARGHKNRRRGAVEERDTPTLETAARLRPNAVEALRRLGVIDEWLVSDAEELTALLVIGSRVASQEYDLTSRAVGRAHHPMDGVSPALANRFRRRYAPWARWAEAQRIGGTSALDLARAVLVDGALVAELAIVLHVLRDYAQRHA